MEAWDPPLFTVPVEGPFVGRGISPGIHVFARQRNPDPLVILSRGFREDTTIIYGWATTGYRCACVCVCMYMCACVCVHMVCDNCFTY